jgi:hypothetical protein
MISLVDRYAQRRLATALRAEYAALGYPCLCLSSASVEEQTKWCCFLRPWCVVRRDGSVLESAETRPAAEALIAGPGLILKYKDAPPPGDHLPRFGADRYKPDAWCERS